MGWDTDEDMLEQLRTIWRLSPPGSPVRLLTEPLGKALHGAVGPDGARAQAESILGDVEGTYLAALALKVLAGEVDVLLHAIGIAAALPHVLEPDEKVLGVSVDHDGGGTAGSAGLGVGDLVTDRQVAEFTFIRWAEKGGNGQREVKLLRDLIKLDLLADDLCDGRRRILYVTGAAPARKFFASGQSLGSKLGRNADVLDRLKERYDDRFSTVGDYWKHARTDNRIELVDLYDVAPDM